MTETKKKRPRKFSGAARASVAAVGSAALAAALLYAGKHRRTDHSVPRKHPDNIPDPETD